MKLIEIQGIKRKKIGKISTNLLRKSGLVPCVIYGGVDNPIHFFTKEISFKNLVYTFKVNTVMLNLEDDIKMHCILKDVQYHPVSDVILHADFYKLSSKKLLSIDIPVILTGRSIGVIAGGVLQLNMRKLRIKVLPDKLPDQILIDTSELNIGDKIYVKEIKKQYNYEFLNPDNCVIVAVKMSRSVTKSNEINKNESEKK